MANRDYRKHIIRALMLVFFGVLAAAMAPDFGVGLRPFIVTAAVVVCAMGMLGISTLPVTGAFRPVAAAAVVLAALYTGAYAVGAFAGPGEAGARFAGGAYIFGSLSLLAHAAALEILCRKLKWTRHSRAWALTQGAIAFLYCAPAILGCLWGAVGAQLGTMRAIATVHYAMTGFEFHGMHVAGIIGGPRWLILVLLAMLAPVSAFLVNILRTYVQVATPPPRTNDSEPIEWSRR